MAEVGYKKVVKGLVADDHGDLLVVRRTLDRVWNPGGWDLIGGTVMADEDLSEAMSREGAEEASHKSTGLELLWGGLVRVFRDFDQAPRRQVVDTAIFNGRVESSQPEPSLNPVEHTDYLWLPPHELQELDGLPEQYAEVALVQLSREITLLD